MTKEIKAGSVAAVVAQANRFIGQKASPGWYDIRKLADVLVEQAEAAVRDYAGGDKDELFELNRRAQVAKAFVNEFFGLIDMAIENAKGLPGFQGEAKSEPVITERIAGSY